jgi:small subunit ribosomal protein S9
MAAISNTFIWGTGRRKTSVARVRVSDGKGKFLVNDRPVDEFFRIPKDRSKAKGPLAVAELGAKLDIFANVHGGGMTGQAGAIAQGLARAILKMHKRHEPEAAAAPAPELTLGEGGAPEAPVAPAPMTLTKKLRKAGLLTRDARMKERKKYGRKGARRSFQFSKR